jgi:putative acetyltransferase
MPVIEIREFGAEDAAAFRALNEEWILRYFALEAKDHETLGDPQGKILAKGGRILMAFLDNRAAGCVALLAMAPGEFEIGKMAVTATSQGTGIGRKLMVRAIELAREMGATRLYLETNHALTPAITLYESVGFRRLPAAESPYKRADVRMELMLLE